MRLRVMGLAGLLAALFFSLIGGAEAQTASRLSFDSNGRFLIHGTPRFVCGVYDSGGSAYLDATGWENQIFTPGGDIWYTRGLAGIPINMYLNYWQGQDIYD